MAASETRDAQPNGKPQSEQTPLLQRRAGEDDDTQLNSANGDVEHGAAKPEYVSFEEDDEENPRNWSTRRKWANVAIIALMALLSPLGSSMFTPAISKMAEDLNASSNAVIGVTTGFVIMLGAGPLVLAPLSETFGRRPLYMWGFGIFTLVQIPTAFAPNLPLLIFLRVIAGFSGSVGVANGGGTINDMFVPSERAGVFGWYLLGPLLGPILGPLLGGIIVHFTSWRWIFGVLAIICFINTALGYFLLHETYAPTILARRCDRLHHETGKSYTFADRDTRPIRTKVLTNTRRPIIILFTQPIVFVMATWQAILFASMYSLFTSIPSQFGKSSPYGFSTIYVGLLYLAPGLGCVLSVRFLVPQIDNIFNKLSKRNNDTQKPEYRLPLALVGSVCLPIALFWFAWTVQRTHFMVPISATVLFGFAQVSVFNTSQNYYIDAFSKYAASAIAAGAVFRSLIGGVVPLFAGPLFDKLGLAWGWSVFAFAMLAMSPAPLVFMKYGERIREKHKIDL